jgi:Ca-activated chloride channel family protein
MLELAWPLAALALVLPWLAARFAPPAAPVTAPLKVPFLRAAQGWQRGAGRSRPRAWLILALAAWAALVAAACRPQWVGELESAPPSGRSLLLALDVSGSMGDPVHGAETGLEILRRTARAFIAGRVGDRVGLIVFGSRAHVQAPPSFDLQAIAAMVEETFIGLAGEGTALGDAIALGVARLRETPRAERVLILLTDGSSTEGAMTVPDAARLARHHGVRVHAVGIGVPGTPDGLRRGEGLDEPALREVAALTGGRYYRADDARALARIYEALEQQEPTTLATQRLRPRTELYSWPLGLALALALAAFLAGMREAKA